MYEIRDNRLYCDGDPVGVRRDIVEFAACALHLPAPGPIPDDAARRMIALERKMLLVAVARTVRDLCGRAAA